MKKYRRTLPVLALLVLLNGCAAQAQTFETEPPKLEATVPTEPLPEIEGEPPETEETVPVRESAEAAETASDTAPAVPASTEGTMPEPAKETEPEQGKEIHTVEQKAEETMPVHIHSYSVDTLEPACTESGYSIYTCDCGACYRDGETDPLGHDWGEWSVVREPDIGMEGMRERLCFRCGALEQEPIEAVKEAVDTAALEAYGNQYAADTYGFAIDCTCTDGFYPPMTALITTMASGQEAVREKVDALAADIEARGCSIWLERDGQIYRVRINVRVEQYQGDLYRITAYYG